MDKEIIEELKGWIKHQREYMDLKFNDDDIECPHSYELGLYAAYKEVLGLIEYKQQKNG